MDASFRALKDRLGTLPRAPGVYIFLDARRRILYIGKAKSLRARVGSYFNESGDGRSLTPYLRAEARDLDFVVTRTEFEALLLENSMIRKEKPKYNVRLRDDKSYVSLRYDPREPFSQLELTRRVKRDGAKYLGPFVSARAVRSTLRQILPLYPLRLCSDHVFNNRSRPCVYYQIGRCPAPCVDKITPEAYRENLEGAVRLLRGNESDLIGALERRMWAASEAHNFEVAADLRDRIAAVKRTVENARVVTTGLLERDVFAMARDGERRAVEVLNIREGNLYSARPFVFSSPVEDEEALTSFLVQYYSDGRTVPPQILLPLALDEASALAGWLKDLRAGAVAIRVPERGEGVKLLAMAERNARLALEKDLGRSAEAAVLLDNLRVLLGLGRTPIRMEAYDISHTAGRETVGVAVTFEHAAPAKDSYRRFKLRAPVAGDDYAAMEEVVRRRFTALLADDAELPDLLVIDGGRGQLNRALAVLKEVGVEPGDLDVIALAKGRTEAGVRIARSTRREKVYLAGSATPAAIAPGAKELHLLDRLRDEAHRFAITYHRKLRAKEQVGSALDAIPGVGPRTRTQVLKAFGSVKALAGVDAREVADRAGIPLRIATRIQERFG